MQPISRLVIVVATLLLSHGVVVRSRHITAGRSLQQMIDPRSTFPYHSCITGQPSPYSLAMSRVTTSNDTGASTLTFTVHGATCDDQEYCCSTLRTDLSVLEIAIGQGCAGSIDWVALNGSPVSYELALNGSQPVLRVLSLGLDYTTGPTSVLAVGLYGACSTPELLCSGAEAGCRYALTNSWVKADASPYVCCPTEATGYGVVGPAGSDAGSAGGEEAASAPPAEGAGGSEVSQEGSSGSSGVQEQQQEQQQEQEQQEEQQQQAADVSSQQSDPQQAGSGTEQQQPSPSPSPLPLPTPASSSTQQQEEEPPSPAPAQQRATGQGTVQQLPGASSDPWTSSEQLPSDQAVDELVQVTTRGAAAPAGYSIVLESRQTLRVAAEAVDGPALADAIADHLKTVLEPWGLVVAAQAGVEVVDDGSASRPASSLGSSSPLPPSPLCLVTAMALVGRRDPHNTAPYSPEELQAVSQAYADLFNDMTLRQVMLDYAVPDPAIDLHALATSAELVMVEPTVVQIYETQSEEAPASSPAHKPPPRAPRPVTIPPPASPSPAAARAQAPPPSKGSGSSSDNLGNVPVAVLGNAAALESNPTGYQGGPAASKASATGIDSTEAVQLHAGLTDSSQHLSSGQSEAPASSSSGSSTPADGTTPVLRIGLAVGIAVAGVGLCAAAAVYFLQYRTAAAAEAAESRETAGAAGSRLDASGEPMTPRSAERAAEEEAKANAALSIVLGPADERY